MLNCKQVSQLVSESIDRQLSLWTRMKVRMHLVMCGICSRFRKIMIRVDREVRQYANDVENDRVGDMPRLSEATRDQIQRELDGIK